MKKLSMLAIAVVQVVFLGSCTRLHHYQVGEIDNRGQWTKTPFELLVNEKNILIRQADQNAKVVSHSVEVKDVPKIVQIFQLGPKTGNLVYNPKYARNLPKYLGRSCPSGRITGLNSIRETRDYLAIGGEIVKITGYCLTRK